MDRDAEGIEFAIKVPTACKPLILLNVSASGHAHASHLFTMPKNGLTAMDRDAEGIEFAIVVPATQKPFERVLVATFMLRIFSFSVFTTFMESSSSPIHPMHRRDR